MAGDEQDLEVDPFDDLRGGFVEMLVGLDGFDFPAESVFHEVVADGDHLLAVDVIRDPAAVLALDAGGVPDVVDVSVGEQERGDFRPAPREPRSRILRRVD